MKYKLIKTYPGYKKLGLIAEFDDSIPSYKIFDGNKIIRLEYVNFIQDNPEFWQLVVEKDYEILLINHNQNIVKYKSDMDCVKFLWEIYSVKRLSDGEIFTVGDDVLSKTCYIPNKILSIELIHDKIRLYPRNNFYYLNDVKKIKQPLFTTEDDVDIFEGDKFWFTNNSFLLSDMKIGKLNRKSEKQNLKFSTKEKAEEFILLNKPCLSINDVAKIFVSTNYTTKKGNLYPQGQQLRDLVKQKLK